MITRLNFKFLFKTTETIDIPLVSGVDEIVATAVVLVLPISPVVVNVESVAPAFVGAAVVGPAVVGAVNVETSVVASVVVGAAVVGWHWTHISGHKTSAKQSKSHIKQSNPGVVGAVVGASDVWSGVVGAVVGASVVWPGVVGPVAVSPAVVWLSIVGTAVETYVKFSKDNSLSLQIISLNPIL